MRQTRPFVRAGHRPAVVLHQADAEADGARHAHRDDRHPVKYTREVEAGVTFVVTRADRPVAEIRPVVEAGRAATPRPVGLAAEEFRVPEDFDAPLP